MTAAAKRLPAGAILYVDHAKHLTPLTLCYHATASRHLTSGRSDVIPPSTSVEVDSAYCPRCLTFCDAASASLGVCNRDAGGCKDCPVCFSPVSLSIDETNGRLLCHYMCGHCQWSSRECGVTSSADKLLDYTTSDDKDEAKEKEAEKKRVKIIAEVSRELELCLQQRIDERNKDGDALFKSITKMWAKKEQEEGRRKRMMLGAISTKGGTHNGEQSWSMETLEKSILEKKKGLDSSYVDGKEGLDPSIEVVKPSSIMETPTKLPTPQQAAAQMTLTTTAPRSRSDLFPLPVAFRARLSRRCRAELAAGRTGILIKPKLNPLEGDTSLRAGHGQWWKKDSSALHGVPRVQLCRHGADLAGGKYAALLNVKNPTLNMIRLRFSGPPDLKKDGGESEELSPLVEPRELQNILVDPFTETYVQGHLCSSDATASLSPTEFFSLDPADDPFLDIGKGRQDDPSGVRDWDAMSAIGALVEGRASQMRLVAAQGDTAWVELVLCDAASDREDSSHDSNANSYLAVPLGLQIEVGNGSWEASLIKRRDLAEEEQDLVTLNLVTLLR